MAVLHDTKTAFQPSYWRNTSLTGMGIYMGSHMYIAGFKCLIILKGDFFMKKNDCQESWIPRILLQEPASELSTTKLFRFSQCIKQLKSLMIPWFAIQKSLHGGYWYNKNFSNGFYACAGLLLYQERPASRLIFWHSLHVINYTQSSAIECRFTQLLRSHKWTIIWGKSPDPVILPFYYFLLHYHSSNEYRYFTFCKLF